MLPGKEKLVDNLKSGIINIITQQIYIKKPSFQMHLPNFICRSMQDRYPLPVFT